jgi:hypothetical protein
VELYNYLIIKGLRHLTLMRHRHHSNCSSSAAILYRCSATTLYMRDTKDPRLPTLRIHHHCSSNSAARLCMPLDMLNLLSIIIKILTTRVEHLHQCPLLSARHTTPSGTAMKTTAIAKHHNHHVTYQTSHPRQKSEVASLRQSPEDRTRT